MLFEYGNWTMPVPPMCSCDHSADVNDAMTSVRAAMNEVLDRIDRENAEALREWNLRDALRIAYEYGERGVSRG